MSTSSEGTRRAGRGLGVAGTLALGALVWVGCASPLTSPRADDRACAQLAEANATLDGRLDALEALPEQLPTDLRAAPQEAEALLVTFGEQLARVQAMQDAAHADHEQGCKSPLVAGGDFEQVFAMVYAPYIEASARQYHALNAMAGQLEAAAEAAPAVASLAAAYRGEARGLRRGLLDQRLVCESDFDTRRCERFVSEVDERLEQPGPSRAGGAASETRAAPTAAAPGVGVDASAGAGAAASRPEETAQPDEPEPIPDEMTPEPEPAQDAAPAPEPPPRAPIVAP